MEVANDPPPPPRRRRRKQRQDHATATVAETSISELPSHLTCDILSRLSLKSIFRCKRVCSSFRNLTLEPHFPQLHLPRSPLSLILFRRSDCRHPSAFGFLPLADSLEALRCRRATMTFETKPEIPAGRGSTLAMVSSCNGLVCLADRYCSDTVYIYNPVTRQHFLLPKPKNEPTVWTQPHTRLHCCVYTLGVDDEWRNIGDTRQPLPHNSPFVFLNGALHWIGSEGSRLLLCYFDMEKEQCGNLPLPTLSVVPFQPIVVTRFHLGVVDNCLYIRDEQEPRLPINVWVTKDYKNIGSWTLEWSIHRQLHSWLGLDLKPLKTLKDGTLLMIVKEKILASYNPVTKLFKRASYHGVQSWAESIADVPSFLPLPGAL
ncbi:hypothetical protein RHGRI_009888 [Rhododendron griersonianum]|uniref:F-box domain-containing protein n=1 Tax=Rhododendron griersonianum TaxID=479676 RepID=A0AAV6KGQ8_9ERIC|nr:hypothetical protein RHGRI_009888 [Rhododendron griersonianum]